MTQIRVNREELLGVLLSVQAGLASKNDAPEQSECFCFDLGYCFTYNDQVAVRLPSSLPKSFKAAVKARPMLKMLQKLEVDEVLLELSNNKLLIKGKRDKTELSIESEIKLEIETIGEPTKWYPITEEFSRAIEIVGECSEKETKNSDFKQSVIYLAPNWIEAYGKKQSARFYLETGLKKPLLVRQASIKHILAFSMKEYANTDAWLHFRNSSKLMFSFRRWLDDDFPYPSKKLTDMYERIRGIPIKLPKGLVQAANRAGILSAEDTDNDNIYIQLQNGKMRVRGVGVSGKYTKWIDLPSYSGDSKEFAASPKLIAELASRHTKVYLDDKYVRVNSGKDKRWIYLARLGAIEAKEEK